MFNLKDIEHLKSKGQVYLMNKTYSDLIESCSDDSEGDEINNRYIKYKLL